MKRNATAVWNGTGKEGTGNLTTQSTLLNKAQYSYKSRFEEGIGTNPEELVAAAHAGCFSMKLAFILNAAGFTADEISTQLFISSNTVISHRKNLQRKLNARNTTHLVFLACQFGLI